MTVEIREETADALPGYARVPIAFWVKSRFHVEPVLGGLGGLTLVEESVTPYVKDYDAMTGEGPTVWAKRWDIANWGILTAFDGGQRVGGAAVAWRTEGLNMLAGREDLVVLWDLRVHPELRGKGVGTLLFTHALAWARERQCRELVVETQNINVPACRFYARQGCRLGAINQYAYGDMSDETQLLWYKNVPV